MVRLLFFFLVLVVVVIVVAMAQSSAAAKPVGLAAAATNARAHPGPWISATDRPLPAVSLARWIPAGEAVEVAGFHLPGGLIYVGAHLPPVNSPYRSSEPALIDPGLKVDRRAPDLAGTGMSYWPNYSEIQPSCRAGYLTWLAGDRRAPDAYIGYVFLFLYGLERRALYDQACGEVGIAELDVIRGEVERLLELYGSNNSFRRYATQFADVCFLLRRSFDLEMLRRPTRREGGWELPFSLRLALASLASENKALPPEWALSWVLTAPEMSLRTPAQRCPAEFAELFELRYRERFGDGVVLRPIGESLEIQYQPASASFGGVVRLATTLPDIGVWPPVFEKLRELADACTQELDAFSRWVGRTGDKESPPALALLPPELMAKRSTPAVLALNRWLEESCADGELAEVAASDLLTRWPCKIPGNPTRRELEALSDYLATQGLGLEPDVVLGGASPVKLRKVVLFRLPERRREKTSSEYSGAMVLLQLAAMVAGADGTVTVEEERHLLAHLEEALELTPVERRRLEARFRFLASEPPSLARVKKALGEVSVSERAALGPFLVSLAGADGHLAPDELKLLAKLYPLLGLDPQSVYSDVHELISAPAAADEPVSMRPAMAAPGFAIPPEKAAASVSIELDLEKIRARLEETARVSQLLGQIFTEEEAAPVAPRPEPAPAGATRVAGLDAAHSALLLALAGASRWERPAVERFALDLALLPDGALEVINEAAFSATGALLLEGDEVLEIDPEILREMLP